jgi:hypothetical protein
MEFQFIIIQNHVFGMCTSNDTILEKKRVHIFPEIDTSLCFAISYLGLVLVWKL